MSRRSCWRRLAEGALALLAICTPVAGAAFPAPTLSDVAGEPTDDGDIVAAVTVDGAFADEPVLLHRRGGVLLIDAADLAALGVSVKMTGAVALDAVPGLGWIFDTPSQTLTLRTRRPARRTVPSGKPDLPDSGPMTPSGWGAIITYDASAARIAGVHTAAALVDASLFTPAGQGFAVLLADAGVSGRSGIRRLAAGYTLTDPERLRRVTLGDFISPGTVWSRPIRMAGLQLSTDFSLRPDLVTFPVPELTGTAAVPSMVDLVVNDGRRTLGGVGAGRFAVTDAPVRTGVNTVSVTVRDALGRETIRTSSLYASRALLKPGLADYSVELGAVRVGYGGAHDRYGALAWTAGARRGLTDRLTAEAHGEGDLRGSAVGVGLTLGAGLLGQLDASLAASTSRGVAGRQISVGYERIGQRVRLVARYNRASAAFRDLAARYDAGAGSQSLLLDLGFDLGRPGTVNAGLIASGRATATRRPSSDRYRAGDLAGPPTDRRAVTFITGGWSARLWRGWSMLASGGWDARRRGGGYAAVNLVAALGERTSLTAAATVRGDTAGAVEVVQTARLPGELGFRAGLAGGDVDRMVGGVSYQGTAARAEISAERVNRTTAVRASARGGVVVMGEGLFPIDAPSGSVALVDTGGEAGVTVYRDNRPIGTTNARGKLMVANLNPFQRTKLSVDPLQLADDVMVDAPDLMVRPSDRTGVSVRFAMHRASALLVNLVDEAGHPLPAGGRASGPDGVEHPIGEGGVLFLAEAPAEASFTVRIDTDRLCVARLPAFQLNGPVTTLHAVSCVGLRLAARYAGHPAAAVITPP